MDPVLQPGLGRGRLAVTALLTLDSSHRGLTVDATANSFTISLTAAATLGSGWHITIFNSGSGTVIIDPNGSETILTTGGAVTTVSLTQGTGYTLECDGVGFGAIAGTTTSGSGSPTGAAGGDLGSTYPNPTVTSVAHVASGTLTVANGGTGTTSVVSTGLLYGNGTTAYTSSANLTYASATGTVALTSGLSQTNLYSTCSLNTGLSQIAAINNGAAALTLSKYGTTAVGTMGVGVNLASLSWLRSNDGALALSTETALPIYLAPNRTVVATVSSTGLALSTLSTGRVVTTGASGLLQDSANLTYVAPTLALTSAGNSRWSCTTSLNTGFADFINFNNLGNYFQFALAGSAVAGNFSTTGVAWAGLAYIQSNVGAILISTGTTAPIYFCYNGTVCAKFDSTSTFTLSEGVNLVAGTGTGTKIGTGTTQKLGFYNSTPIVKPTGSIVTALSNLGLVGSGTIATTDITAGTLTVNSIISLPSSATAGDGGRIELRELAANGTSAVKISAPDSLAADTAYTLPSALPASTGSSLICDTSGVMSWSASSAAGYTGYIVLEDQAVSGTSGQTTVSTTWNKRTLTASVANVGGYMTLLSASRFTLAAGTYRLTAVAPCYKADRHRLRVYNFTDSTVVATSSGFYCETTISGGHAYINCRFTLATAKALELDHYTANGVVSGGGVETSDGSTEIYTHIEILRE